MNIQPALKKQLSSEETSGSWKILGTVQSQRCQTGHIFQPAPRQHNPTKPAKVNRYDKILQACANWKQIAEFDLSIMFFQMNLRRSTESDLKKLSHLCIQTDEGSSVYTRPPQGLPDISEYQEDLTDLIFET